ncbi:MAG: type II toxin-antitoxin system VapC family toxin [Pseudomonadota bacterium]|nr:type II toxin-antitoxin system VapC family toxin [Pseudomonadota bacterium]
MYLVDSNVLLDIVKAQEPFNEWSATALENALIDGPVLINPIIYAEISIAYASPADLDRVLARLTIGRHDVPWAAAFLAGQAFLQYRRQGGQKTAPLPDFYIGADAQISGFTLITRDARRYRSYFPALNLLTMD